MAKGKMLKKNVNDGQSEKHLEPMTSFGARRFRAKITAAFPSN